MSEQRRTTLTPFGKSDKKSNKSPQKTYRLTFTLSDPNENSCPVFDYAATVKSEERKFLKKHREEKNKQPNGFVDPFEDDDEDVKRLARKFEAKYGDKKKLKSYADLGAGYDETDPFIDNTDANDEALQEDQETACGGYYINSGPLELKRVEVSDHSDADEVKKRGRKRSLPVIEEDEDEDDEEEKEDGGEEDEEEVSQRDLAVIEEEEEEAGEDVKVKPAVEEGPPEPKKTKLLEERVEPEKPPTLCYNGVDDGQVVKKKKKKRECEDDNADGSLAKTKKAKTVKALLEEKRTHEPPSRAEEPKRQTASDTSIAEAIESVVNAGNNQVEINQEENSNSSHSAHSAATVSSSVSDDSQDERRTGSDNAPPPLPDNLSPEVATLVNNIKQTAGVTDNTRKTFCSEINNNLIKLEWKTRELSSASRNMVFAFLAHHLPCTKETLMRRSKKLFLQKEENHMETIICKLKATIDATMPTLLEEYAKECQRIAEEKGLPAAEGTTPGDENTPTTTPTSASASPHLPRRKFPWTDETRGYLVSIVRCKQKCHRVSKPRKASWEETLQAFLCSKIKPLWPNGWMKPSVLERELKRSPNSVKSKHSSHHSSGKHESSRQNLSVNFSSPSSNGSLYTSPSGEPKPTTGADPINLLTKISSYPTPSQPNKPNPSHHQPVKSEKPETFSMDCLLKRTSEVSSHDYNTTLSDLIKKEGVIMNGTSLPLKPVNSSQKNDRSEKILDLSSCNNVSATPSVIQSTASSERTTARGGDSARSSPAEKPHKYGASLSGGLSSGARGGDSARVCAAERPHNYGASPSGARGGDSARMCAAEKSHNYGASPSGGPTSGARGGENTRMGATEKSHNYGATSGGKESKSGGGERERESDLETTTATDLLNQIINEQLRSPPYTPAPAPAPAPTKAKDEVKSQPVHKDQELLYDVMQDLKELNHLSSGSRDGKVTHNSSFSGGSWSYPVKSLDNSKSNPFHNEFLNYISSNTKDAPVATSTPAPTSLPYSRHNISSYDNSPYVNEVNKSMYSHSPLRTSQGLTAHTSTPSNKVTQMNQMKNLPNTGISSGLPHRYMGQMDYGTEDQHLMGLASSLQYSLPNWPYTGSESQSHQ